MNILSSFERENVSASEKQQKWTSRLKKSSVDCVNAEGAGKFAIDRESPVKS
jgi:hypothetical protein